MTSYKCIAPGDRFGELGKGYKERIHFRNGWDAIDFLREIEELGEVRLKQMILYVRLFFFRSWNNPDCKIRGMKELEKK